MKTGEDSRGIELKKKKTVQIASRFYREFNSFNGDSLEFATGL